IVSGGGGAALTPTHSDDINELRGSFELKSSFSEETTSRRLAWRNLLFIFFNARFSIIRAPLYLLTSCRVYVAIGRFGLDQFQLAFHTTVRSAMVEAGAVFWTLFILCAFIAFTYTKSKLYQWIAGLLHGWIPLLGIFLIGWGATYFTVTELGLRF